MTTADVAISHGTPRRARYGSMSRDRRCALRWSYFFLVLFAIFFLTPAGLSDDDDFGAACLLPDSAASVVTGQRGQADVEQDHVGPEFDCGKVISCFP